MAGTAGQMAVNAMEKVSETFSFAKKVSLSVKEKKTLLSIYYLTYLQIQSLCLSYLSMQTLPKIFLDSDADEGDIRRWQSNIRLLVPRNQQYPFPLVENFCFACDVVN